MYSRVRFISHAFTKTIYKDCHVLRFPNKDEGRRPDLTILNVPHQIGHPLLIYISIDQAYKGSQYPTLPPPPQLLSNSTHRLSQLWPLLLEMTSKFTAEFVSDPIAVIPIFLNNQRTSDLRPSFPLHTCKKSTPSGYHLYMNSSTLSPTNTVTAHCSISNVSSPSFHYDTGESLETV